MSLVPGPPAPGSPCFKYSVGQRVLCRIIEQRDIESYIVLALDHNVRCAYYTEKNPALQVGDEVHAVVQSKSGPMLLLVDPKSE